MATETRTSWRHLAVTGVILLAGSIWYLLWRAGAGGPAAIAYLAAPLGVAVAGHAIFQVIREVPLAPPARRFWLSMLILHALVVAGLVPVVGAAFRDPTGVPTMPLATAVLLGGGNLVAMWAVGRVPTGVRHRGERRRQWLDRTIALLGCGTVLYTVGLAPLIAAPVSWSPQALLVIGMSQVLAVAGITKVSYIAASPVDRAALRLVGLTGLVGAGVAVVATMGGHPGVVAAHAVVVPIAPMLMVAAVRRQRTCTVARPHRANSWLPYLAVAVADLSLLTLPDRLTWSGRLVIAVTVLLSALVAVRQYVAMRENARLLRERRVSEERLRHEVTHDALTGLANRRLFRERLAEALAADGATVLLVDLDDFKTVNDSLGHEIGDQLLVAVAGSLRAAVGPEALPVRLGGDEFAVLAGSPAVSAETLAQRVLDAFTGPMSDHDLLVHASVGIATAGPGATVDDVLRDADTALYAAKQRGKGNSVRYHDSMQRPILAHARLGGELRRALDDGEFRVFYQPIMELDRSGERGRGRVVGVEPLVRWQHPTRGLVLPADFIPAAEGTGLIVPLGRFVLREACRQAAAWLAEFGPDALQKIGPNVSVRQLHDPDFVADVVAALTDSGLPTDRVVLELTESAVLRGPQVLRTLNQLHDMGIRLALDDFGTGESSLSLLRAFPAAIVKLDKSFVDGIELDEQGTPQAAARQAVAHAVIELARAFRLDTVAEGIESQEQVDRLLALGYTLGQGYHLARPMTAEAMTGLLAAQRDLAPVG